MQDELPNFSDGFELPDFQSPETTLGCKEPAQQPIQTVSFAPEYHSCTDISNFIDTHPSSFILVPVSQRGILRIHRNTKRGYFVQFFTSLRDELENKMTF